MSFPTTQWTQLAEATANGGVEAREAMEALCQRYYQPVYRTICVKNPALKPVAEDLTQAFMMHTVRYSLFKKADREKGRFRSFLLTALRNYMIDHYHKGEGRDRKAGVHMVSLEEEPEPVWNDDNSVQIQFDREWALATLENAMERVRRDYEERGKAAWFAVLKYFLPGNGNAGEMTHEHAAEMLGMSTGGVRVEIHRIRQRFKEALRREVARTVSAPHEIDEELQYLKQVLMRG